MAWKLARARQLDRGGRRLWVFWQGVVQFLNIKATDAENTASWRVGWSARRTSHSQPWQASGRVCAVMVGFAFQQRCTRLIGSLLRK